jgi:tetratricopeptide (TPR) repeat protein
MKRSFWPGLFICIAIMATEACAQDINQNLTAANQLYSAKEYVKAIPYYENAKQIDPNSVAAYQGLGNCYYALGRNAEALSAFEKVLSLNPGNNQLASFVKTLKTQTGPIAPAVTASATPSVTATPSPSDNFEISAMAGAAIGMEQGLGLGFGGGASGYYLLENDIGIGASIGYRSFSSSAGYSTITGDNSFSIIEILGSGKYSFEGNEFWPYLVAGAGLALSPSPFSTYPMVELGGGAQYSISNELDLFGQVTYNVLFSDGGTFSYIPVMVGIVFNL